VWTVDSTRGLSGFHQNQVVLLWGASQGTFKWKGGQQLAREFTVSRVHS
jgi:hypothetical protein